MSNSLSHGILKGEVLQYHWPVWLAWNRLYDNWQFFLQNRLIQTSQTGGQQYSDTSPFSIPCLSLTLIIALASAINYDHKWRSKLWSHSLTTLEASFKIVIFLWYRPLVSATKMNVVAPWGLGEGGGGTQTGFRIIFGRFPKPAKKKLAESFRCCLQI